jgi:adenylate cyclase
MDYARFAPLLEWLAAAGLSGQRELNLLQGFCERALAAGLPLGRAVFGVDTLHPVLEGRVFYWERDAGGPVQSEYGRLDPERSEDKWLQSPFHQLYETGATTLRQRLANEPLPFPVLEELRQGASTAHIIETLVETYLGRDAGHRVLSGHIQRGVAEKISAVLWFSDLQGFTRITDTAPPEHLVPLLNDYADAIVSALRGEGGEVLKFMGDGILAIFDAAAPQDACRQALDAAADAIRRVGALNQRRAADGQPVTHFYLGLHVGEVFYGNIGSFDRLDFTVVGPAVNETSRIAAMCRSLDQDVLLSSAFAEAAGPSRSRLVSVGRYALRGVQRPQELYTLEPEAVG